MRIFAKLCTLSCVLLTAGCASFDPNNVIGRHFPAGNDVPVATTASASALTPAQRAEAFDFVWQTIDRRYYDPKMNGVNWQAMRERYRPIALAAANDEAFWDELDRMAGELRDSHTRVESPRRAEARKRNESVTLGLNLAWLGDALVVVGVNNQTDAWWAGIRPGMTVQSIDGQPARAAYDALLSDTRNSSSDRARHATAIGRLNRGEVGSVVRIAVKRSDGTELAATLKRSRVASPPAASSRILPSGFGYIRFSNFFPQLTESIKTGFADSRNAPGLIIDLRGNGGGSLGMTRDLLSELFRERTVLSRQLTRDMKPITVGFGLIDVIRLEYDVPARPDAYTGPVVVLINEGSGSGSEYFAATLQALGRATIVGTTSCGCLLGFLGYANVPGGADLAYSEIGFMTPDGKRIEGDGVKPDWEVKPTLADLQLYRDRALETAEQLLRTEVEKRKLAK
ncbi:MAG: S41 family peptidase [Burkholderiales bacterium]|nr:S41 family peptidase [Burkholderiales bacterium]